MTRDEVLEQAARHLEEPAFPWVPDPMVSRPWAERVRALKSKPPEKSPEVEDLSQGWLKCPDCGDSWRLAGPPVVLHDGPDTATWDLPTEDADRADVPPQREVTTDIDRLVDEREAWRRQAVAAVEALGEVQGERDALKARLEAAQFQSNLWKDEAEVYRKRWESEQSRAAEAIARVEALTAEVKHREWVDNGAKMEGETSCPSRHGRLGPTPENMTQCLDCGETWLSSWSVVP